MHPDPRRPTTRRRTGSAPGTVVVAAPRPAGDLVGRVRLSVPLPACLRSDRGRRGCDRANDCDLGPGLHHVSPESVTGISNANVEPRGLFADTQIVPPICATRSEE